MNDKQYDRKHQRATTPRARALSDEHITMALDELTYSIDVLRMASKARKASPECMSTLANEGLQFTAFVESSYALFFTCTKLFPSASNGVLERVHAIGILDCQNVRKGVHPSNLTC